QVATAKLTIENAAVTIHRVGRYRRKLSLRRRCVPPIGYSHIDRQGYPDICGIESTPLEPEPVQTGGGSADMSDFSSAFPNSTKLYVDGPQGVRVPMREVSLERGQSSIQLYDTSGPQDADVRSGLPKLREAWVDARLRSRGPRASFGEAGSHPVTQLYYARNGEITPQREFIAI